MSARMTTPPPATSMPAVPDTPRWGYDDNYEPYPATRAATRRLQSAQKTEKAGVPATPRKSSHITLASGVKVKRPVFTGTAFSGTPPATQAKKSGRTIVFEDETKLNLNGSPSKKVQPKASTGTGMFATPARSPEKKKVENIEGLGSISRTLFSARHAKLEDAMPSPRKRGKYADLIGGASKEPIAIFTDSKEMIPEKDNSIDNPFYGSGRRHAAAGGALKKSRKRKAGAFEEEVKKTETESKGAMYML